MLHYAKHTKATKYELNSVQLLRVTSTVNRLLHLSVNINTCCAPLLVTHTCGAADTIMMYFSGDSLRLAYQDLSLQEKQADIKLSKMEQAKKEQAQRLGMGMGKTE